MVSGITNYGLIGIMIIGVTIGNLSYSQPTDDTQSHFANNNIKPMPFWQFAHPIQGNCGVSTNPALETAHLSLNPKCKNAFPELAKAQFWTKDFSGNINILSKNGERLARFAKLKSGIYAAVKPSQSQLQIISPVI